MCGQERERRAKERFARLHPVPGRSPRRMWQRNAFHGVAAEIDAKFFANDVVQRWEWQELIDGELADRQHKLRFQQLPLAREPGGAVGNLLLVGHAITAGFLLAREAAADGGEI